MTAPIFFIPLLLLHLLSLASSLPLTEGTVSCLDGSVLGISSEEECFTSFDEIATDLDFLGTSLDTLKNRENAKESEKEIKDIPNPTKKLTIAMLEEGINQNDPIKDTPAGYLTKFGYLKGALSARGKCNEAVTMDDFLVSMETFKTVSRTQEGQGLFHKMSEKRCSLPDITFDEDGNLDDYSAEIMGDVLTLQGHSDHANRLRRDVEERRVKRYALQPQLLDLESKPEYTYKLHNGPTGQKLSYAQTEVDTAFKAWESAIGPAIKFTRAEEGELDADVNLMFVPDKHNDYTFQSDNELAHAPFPHDPQFHGGVHYRDTANWDETDDESVNFLYVTIHELGHFLGLKHSREAGSVMEPIIGADLPGGYAGQLHEDDILAVKMAYGNSNVQCDKTWYGFEGACYKVHTISRGVTWDEAQLQCKAEGGLLASVTNSPLNAFLLQRVANGRTPTWIGRKSSARGWANDKNFDWWPRKNKAKEMNPKNEKCLRMRVSENSPVWQFIDCNGGDSIKTEHFICEKGESEGPIPTTPPVTMVPPTEEKATSGSWPCQNYIRAALRRGNFLYLFGNTIFAKYFFTSNRPRLARGYPKYINEEFEGIPPSFTAVVNSPYMKRLIYFVDGSDVYEWKLNDVNSDVEQGELRRKNKKPRKLSSLFRTSGVLTGASTFDKNSVFLFEDTGKVGKWTMDFVSADSRRLESHYETVKKWKFDTDKINAVTNSFYENYLMFFRGESYFSLRKSDGAIPKKFKRAISSDFLPFEICSFVAPIVDEYPVDIHPDDALADED